MTHIDADVSFIIFITGFIYFILSFIFAKDAVVCMLLFIAGILLFTWALSELRLKTNK